MAQEKKRGLGRGLSALMADVDQKADAPTVSSGERVVPIELVNANPDQPRRRFDENDLTELTSSIAEKGIIQPLIVRAHPSKPDSYEIVAGERRWRAAQRAGLHEVPVIKRSFTDTEVLEVAIIENIQRADLNPLEEALGFQQLMEKFERTQEQMATALGKSRPYIANALRLLSLPDTVKSLLAEGKLTAGHARALVSSDRAAELALDVVKRGLSVRETEKLAKKGPVETKSVTARAEKDADTKALEGDLSAALGMRVTLEHNPGNDGGTLFIRYRDLDQLDDLCRALGG